MYIGSCYHNEEMKSVVNTKTPDENEYISYLEKLYKMYQSVVNNRPEMVY